MNGGNTLITNKVTALNGCFNGKIFFFFSFLFFYNSLRSRLSHARVIRRNEKAKAKGNKRKKGNSWAPNHA
jgi:hypothetical protein